MDIIIDQQVALDEALVPHASRLRIGKNVPEIYMQEFWETATVHHHSIRFKMNIKKHIMNLEYFREMLQICPRIPNQQFDELPFEEEILAFIKELGHSGEIKMITYVNINKLHQPRRLKKQSSSDTIMPPPTATGKRLKTSVKVGKPAKGMQPVKSSKAKVLTMLSEVALTEAEHIKLATKRSLTQTHISHASRSDYNNDHDEEKISEHDDDVDDQSDDDYDQDDDDDEQTDSDNDVDDFSHPKFSTHDKEDKDEESFDPIVQTPSLVEDTDDEDNNEDRHGMNVEGDEGANEEDEANELYRDVNINLKGIDSIFESTPRVDVSVMTTAELPLLSATTLPSPSIPIISHVQQKPAPSLANVPSSSLQDLLNFGSLFGIVDKYLDHRMNEAVKVAVQLQSDRLRDEAQVENEDFLNKLDENIFRRYKGASQGVKSYQKKLNLTKPDTYRSDLKRKEAYTTYSNPRGFIYQNKGKKNRLMRIDKLQKFSDNTLNDVRTALDDLLKGILMQYLPQTIWRSLLVGDYTRETFGCYKGPFDFSYDVLIKEVQLLKQWHSTPCKILISDGFISYFKSKDGIVLLSVLMSGDRLDRDEHMIIPGKVPIYIVSPWDGLILSHEEVADDLCESRIVHLIMLFGILVFYLIHKILP
nr:hypothetical protein [Tanacetum cinerariifolium]